MVPTADGAPTILVVDDEALTRQLVSAILVSFGNNTLEAASGTEGLSVLQANGVRVDLLVTDVKMPGLDGPAFYSEALKTIPDLKVLFLSGDAEDATPRCNEVAPNAPLIPKPFKIEEILACVRDLLGCDGKQEARNELACNDCLAPSG